MSSNTDDVTDTDELVYKATWKDVADRIWTKAKQDLINDIESKYKHARGSELMETDLPEYMIAISKNEFVNLKKRHGVQ